MTAKQKLIDWTLRAVLLLVIIGVLWLAIEVALWIVYWLAWLLLQIWP